MSILTSRWFFPAVVVGTILLVLLAAAGSILRVQSGYAERAAQRWADNLGLQVAALSCANVDSNSDSYVSCTIRLKDSNDLLFVECPALSTVFITDECRLQRTISGR